MLLPRSPGQGNSQSRDDLHLSSGRFFFLNDSLMSRVCSSIPLAIRSAWIAGCSGGLLLFIFTAFATGGCSTYSRDTYQSPREGEGVIRREARDPFIGVPIHQAVYTTPEFQFSAWVVLGGSRRVALGPCLLPIIPGTKHFPRHLEVVFYISPSENSPQPIQLIPGEWQVILGKSDSFSGLENDTTIRPFSITSRTADDLRSLSGRRIVLSDGQSSNTAVRVTEPLRFDLTFPEFDHRFDGFVLKGVRIRSGGRTIALPEIRFESKSRGRYTPFTTKILDL